MRGTFAVSQYVAKAMLIRRWNARIVWAMQRQAASNIMATWRANAFLRSCAGGGSAHQHAPASAPDDIGDSAGGFRALGDGSSYDLNELD